MINPSVDAAAAAAAAAAAMITPGPVLSDKWVSASLAINAAVWDACAIVLFHRLYTAWGLVAVLVSGSFQCLALSTMQPHALAAINGISVVLALTLQRTTAKRLNRMQKLAVIFMISASYSLWSVGLLSVDLAGRYECDPRLVAIQFFFVAISVTILVVK
jgi:hypothetical protein